MKHYYLERDGIEILAKDKPRIIVSEQEMLINNDTYAVFEEENGILKLIGYTTDELME